MRISVLRWDLEEMRTAMRSLKHEWARIQEGWELRSSVLAPNGATWWHRQQIKKDLDFFLSGAEQTEMEHHARDAFARALMFPEEVAARARVPSRPA